MIRLDLVQNLTSEDWSNYFRPLKRMLSIRNLEMRSEKIGPSLNEDGILNCGICKEMVLHDYYGSLCRLGYYSPSEQKSHSDYISLDLVCPYYKEKERNDKLDDLLGM